jgi:preprotein translocase subunit SecB
MKPAFLSLEDLVIERFLVQGLKEHDPEAEEDSTTHTARVNQLSHHGGDESLWRMGLSIRVKPSRKGGSPPPYRIEVDLAGLFSVSDIGRAQSEVAYLVGVNGASMLYSAAREQIFIVTSRGLWGGFQLPTVTFTDLKVAPTVPDRPGC